MMAHMHLTRGPCSRGLGVELLPPGRLHPRGQLPEILEAALAGAV